MRFDIFKLTVTVLPYKTRHACAVVVIDSVYASPIVETGVWITVINV